MIPVLAGGRCRHFFLSHSYSAITEHRRTLKALRDVTCLRIGNFGDAPLDHRRLAIWLKPEDFVQLIRIGLEHPDIRFEIFFGSAPPRFRAAAGESGQPERIRA
jgi:hypothetical protein